MSTDSAAPSETAAADAARVAVRYLTDHGYDTTTANELADAMGLSRATFFRRFGGKDDLIFADHETSLAALTQLLDESVDSPTDTVTRGAVDRMQRIVRDPEHARLRADLLRHNPALREHELVITHRYERVFSDYLASVAAEGTPRWVPTALGAAVVAVHNAAVREWLRAGDARTLGALERDLRELMGRFSTWFGDDAGESRVVVAAFEASASPDVVLAALQRRLNQ